MLNDYDFIKRLPTRERIAGIAEAVKVALIRDGDFFNWLEANADDLATFEPDPLASKKLEIFEKFIELGMVSVTLDPGGRGVSVPQQFMGRSQLVLNFSHRF